MKQEKIYAQLKEIQQLYKKQEKANYSCFCKEEHLSLASENIYKYLKDKSFLKVFEVPKFEEEQIIEREKSFNSFLFLIKENTTKEFVEQFEKTTIKDFLILLGQRITPATIRNIDALPPLNEHVFKASFAAYNSQISKAVRAFEKHAKRSSNNFWGIVQGSPKEKEKHVQELVKHLLEDKTWWNVFYHYKHELVYEVRIASGHGARWKKSNLEFIGFVEPFLNTEKNELEE